MGGAKPKLFVEYIRLPQWRQQQEKSFLLQTFRVAVHTPTTDVVANTFSLATTALDGQTAAITKVLKPTGRERKSGSSAAVWRGKGMGNAAAGVDASQRECTWRGITSAQLPQFLFVCLQKRIDMTCHNSLKATSVNVFEAPAQGALAHAAIDQDQANRLVEVTQRCQYLARNTDGNASITRFALEIMSVQGSFIYSADTWPYLKSRSQLYRDVQKNCVDDFPDEDNWYKNDCIVYLNVSDFAMCFEFGSGLSSEFHSESCI